MLRDEWMECNSWGQHDANWLGFYDYFREVCGLVDQTKKLEPLTALAKETGWHLFYKNVAILSEKPTLLKRDERGRLHCTDGAALTYTDGFSLYHMSGVRVSKEQAEIPKDQITRDMLLGETNVDVRRELVKKVGIDRAIELLKAKVIDSETFAVGGKYELLAVDLGDGRVRPYLKMQNPSIDAVHIEGVEPGINTVKAALAWRNKSETFVQPNQLT